MKANHTLTNKMELKFSKRQEYVRKDIERCVGVLVKKYHILENPLRGWYIQDIKELIDCCVILHNMTTENRLGNFHFSDSIEVGDIPADLFEVDNDPETVFLDEEALVGEDVQAVLAARIAHMNEAIEDELKFTELYRDLQNHIWDKH